MYIQHFVYPLSDNGCLDCFSLLTVVNNATMNMGVQISVWVSTFRPFGYIPRSGIAGSHDNFMFNLLKDYHTIFTATASFYVLTSNAQGFQFLHTLATFIFYVCGYFFIIIIDVLMSMTCRSLWFYFTFY